MTLGERIKKARKTLDLTQQKFGKRIGIKPNSISLIESGNRNASEQVVLAVCREFNISEAWLRTGEGEMFLQQSQEDELSAAVERLLAGESSEFKRRLVVVLSKLDEKEWEMLERRLNEITAIKAEPAFAPALVPATEEAERDQLEQEADEFATLAREQFLSEKRQESQVSSVKKSGGRLA